MWARRCGAPPKWPSRVKVTLMSVGTLAIGLAVYQILAGDDVSYLDVDTPVIEEILCLTRWPLRDESIFGFTNIDSWEEWASYRFDEAEFIKAHRCSVPDLGNQTCSAVALPLRSIDRALGRPLGTGDTLSYDVLDMYAYLFLLLAGWTWLQVLAHDLSLLASSNKDFVLDLSGVREEFPWVVKSFRLIGCGSLREACCSCETKCGRLLGFFFMLLTAPLALTWSVVVFLAVAVPLVAVIFICYPARMSRFGTFLASLSCAIYGLILAIHNIVYLCVPDSRADFAVTWRPRHGEQPECICGCIYKLSFTIVWQFALVGAVTVAKSIFLAARCLKGLRRRNWANMLSVTFPVPVTAYAVEWTTHDKKPIKHREASGKMKPVQGELAFDPFAMMDEQPDSAFTTLHLKPVRVNRLLYDTRGKKREIRTLEGPDIKAHVQMQAKEEIGCCGFPCRTGGFSGSMVFEDEEGDPRTPATRAVPSAGPASPVPQREQRPRPSIVADTVVTDDVSILFEDHGYTPVSSVGPMSTSAQGDGRGRRLDWREQEEGGVADGIRAIGSIPESEQESALEDNCQLIDEQFDQSVGGLGFVVSWPEGDDALPFIDSVLPTGEADRRGFLPGDMLISLNGVETHGRSRSELMPILKHRPLRICLQRRARSAVFGRGFTASTGDLLSPSDGGGGKQSTVGVLRFTEGASQPRCVEQAEAQDAAQGCSDACSSGVKQGCSTGVLHAAIIGNSIRRLMESSRSGDRSGRSGELQ